MSGHCTTSIGGRITVVWVVIRGVRCPVEVIGGRSLACASVITPEDGPGGDRRPPMRDCWRSRSAEAALLGVSDRLQGTS